MGEMRQVSDFLGQAGKENADELAGKSTGGGGFDGPTLNERHEYRLKVARAEWRQANGSGNWSYSITYEVIEDPSEDDEFLGRKFSEYYSIDKGNRIAQEQFSKFIGQSGVNLADVDQSDNQRFIDAFVGVQFVAAVRTWGKDSDRTGVRWLNKDNGQALRTNIEPKKPTGGTVPLQADIAVNKNRGPVLDGNGPKPKDDVIDNDVPEDPTEQPAQQEQITLPGGNLPTGGGIKLPPGLQS